MPRGRSTFHKRQKELARQQKQRDKAERKSQRKTKGPRIPWTRWTNSGGTRKNKRPCFKSVVTIKNFLEILNPEWRQ